MPRYIPKWMRRRIVGRCINAMRRIPTAMLYPVRYKYGYTSHYYLGRSLPETEPYNMGMIRPSDMGAAMAYSLGYRDYDSVVKLFGLDPKRPRHFPPNLKCDVQIRDLMAGRTRTPKLAIDVGAGRGEITASFLYAGVDCIAIEPSVSGLDLVKNTSQKWYNMDFPESNFLNSGVFDGMRQIEQAGRIPDTVIMCECLEHIGKKEFWRAYTTIRHLLAKSEGILVVTNWIDLHPIQRDILHWDHIHTVDDRLYDEMARYAARTVFRQGSHIVLQF